MVLFEVTGQLGRFRVRIWAASLVSKCLAIISFLLLLFLFCLIVIYF